MSQKVDKETTTRTTKQNSSNKQNKPSSNKSTKKKRKNAKLKVRIRWIILFSMLFLSVVLLAGVLVFNLKYGEDFKQYQLDAKQLVEESNLDTFRQMETSLVYDTGGNLTSVLKGEKDVYYLDYKDIPDLAKMAMISIEDKKFMTHEGIDVKANIRAAVALIRHKGGITQGASTITQQLARTIFLSNEVSIERKLKEIFIAFELEKKYSKTEILEFYLNNIYFANGYYGIQAASQGYFSKSVEELNLAQIAFLCAIPNNPTIYDPLDHPDNTKKRSGRILLQMYKDGKIGKEEYQKASNEKIKIVQKKMNKNNYVETYVYYCAARALMQEQGFEFRNEFQDEEDQQSYEDQYHDLYNQCQKSLYYEGYRIYTSIDFNKQQQLQEAVDETLKDYTDVNEEGTYSLQGAAVSVDNNTGKVVAIVGGRYQESTGYTLNRGYQSYRQPGSSIKPLIVYTPSFERGYYPDDIVLDKKFKGGPSNSNGTYSGKIELRKAVEQSKNVIAWKLFGELTPEVGLPYLLRMNFAKIDKNDYYPAASLGGFTTGVSPVEMTAAYATLENDGVYREPTCIIKILDAKGDIIVGEDISEKRIYDSNAARMMTDVLTGVILRGTGKGLGLDNMISAGKTGTTSEKKDGWFVGYTPYYTTGVWVGYDIPKAMKELSGASFPGTIWKRYMNEIHEGLKSIDFTPYEDNRTPKEDTEDKAEQTLEDTLEEQKTTEEASTDLEGQNSLEGENTSETTEEDWNDNNTDFPDSTQEYEDSLEEFPSSTETDLSEEDNETDLTDEELWEEDDSWSTGEETQEE